jgi:hypothetical protein
MPWYCLTFFDVFCITLFALVGFGLGTHWRTSENTMAKTNKDKECYMKHMEERQTIPWPKPTMKNNVIQNPWHCLTFFDVFYITLFILVGFGHSSVWRSSMCFA